MNGAEAIVLGVFGCGAFRNDPRVVAAAAKTVIGDYLHAFRAIEFAVYCHPGDSANYDAFARNWVTYCTRANTRFSIPFSGHGSWTRHSDRSDG